jgi:hypothetical protein
MPAPRARLIALASAALITLVPTSPANAGIVPTATPPAAALAYPDLVDLADGTPIVARVEVRKAAALKPEQAQGVRPGFARIYVEARTRAVLLGDGLGESLHFLADVPFDAVRRRPVMPKGLLFVFARPVRGSLGEVQLVAPDAAVAWNQETETRLRGVLTELVDPAAPPKVQSLRDVLHVAGTLTGEGETQIFVATTRDPFAISVVRSPGAAPHWGLSLGDAIDPAARQPERNTLLWYRLACFLPRNLPVGANISSDPADIALAAEDYAKVILDLGSCPRSRH